MNITEINAYNEVCKNASDFVKKYDTPNHGCGFKFSILDVTDFEYAIEYFTDPYTYVKLHYISGCACYFLSLDIIYNSQVEHKIIELPISNNYTVTEILQFIETINNKLDF